jgi:cellulose synthase/poly-beta-1,6-N-acetylglucosamine synthase-like glycosyltransferase
LQHGLSFTFAARMPNEFILPIILLIPAAVQVLYFLVVYARFAFSRAKKVEPQTDMPISVVVCGRNEEENFANKLPLLLEQDYPDYEVVAVNDQSKDNSKDVLEGLQDKYPHLRVVDVKENDRFWQGKKFGLTLGIKAALHEHLLFTDADCIPASKNWISEMAAGFSEQKQLVLGVGVYEKKPGLLNMLIRFETLFTAIQYISWAFWGTPYMGVGRNLAYTKTLFFAQKGFVPHMHIPMGDDDLFVNAAGTRKNSTAVYTKDSFTVSEPETKYGKWFEQKRRHLATSTKYKKGHKVALGFYGATVVLYFISIISGLILPNIPVWFWYGIGARLIVQYLIFTFSAKKTDDWDLLILLPFLELFLLVNQLLILLANTFNKQYQWK